MASSNQCFSNCAFSTKTRKCPADSTAETFKRIICGYHLSLISGVTLSVNKFESESETVLIGPFLIVDENFHFNDRTIVFPTRSYIDMHLNCSAKAPDYFNFALNPRTRTFIDNLLKNKSNLPAAEARYQLELLRNLFLEKNEVINLTRDSQESHQDLLTTVSTRIFEMNQIIAQADYKSIIKSTRIANVTDGKEIDLSDLSPFMQFMLINCVADEHKLPVSDGQGIGLTAYMNLIYKPGYGMISTAKMFHPINLVFDGSFEGGDLYNLKVNVHQKQTVQRKRPFNARDLPDNSRVSNILSSKHDFCISRPY